MNVIELPFVRKVGITENNNQLLELSYDNSVLNHVQSIHAGAQYSLAETASGALLQRAFPELEGKVIPVLRDSQVKFKKPAMKTIVARASIEDEAIEKFRVQFEKKNRASIQVNVDVSDTESTLICVAVFNWFVQGL